MDWRTDEKTLNVSDEFMFGPAILVNPVLKADATHRTVYLPASPKWYDFWTGVETSGGKEIEADAPLERMPLYVRAGSIVPMGPEIEYASENPGGAIELRIYRGADGEFNLYEDSGDSYDYEKGQHSVIPLVWNERTGVITIGGRKGTFPGMVEKRTFRIVVVGNGHGVGGETTKDADREIAYDGTEIKVSLR
jgi:alpha-D-xyloside xylohydrolase